MLLSTEVSDDLLLPRSSAAERAESFLLPRSTAVRRRPSALFIVMLVNTHDNYSQNLTTKLLKIAYGVSSVCDFMNI